MGSGLKMKYFVLKPGKDGPYGRASRLAMLAYADAIQAENLDLATELNHWANVTGPEYIDGCTAVLDDEKIIRGLCDVIDVYAGALKPVWWPNPVCLCDHGANIHSACVFCDRKEPGTHMVCRGCKHYMMRMGGICTHCGWS